MSRVWDSGPLNAVRESITTPSLNWVKALGEVLQAVYQLYDAGYLTQVTNSNFNVIEFGNSVWFYDDKAKCANQ